MYLLPTITLLLGLAAGLWCTLDYSMPLHLRLLGITLFSFLGGLIGMFLVTLHLFLGTIYGTCH